MQNLLPEWMKFIWLVMSNFYLSIHRFSVHHIASSSSGTFCPSHPRMNNSNPGISTYKSLLNIIEWSCQWKVKYIKFEGSDVLPGICNCKGGNQSHQRRDLTCRHSILEAASLLAKHFETFHYSCCTSLKIKQVIEGSNMKGRC